MIDIYQESPKNTSDSPRQNKPYIDLSVYKMVSFDLDDKNLSLMKVISSIKDAMATVPDDNFLGIYLVSGLDVNIHSFWPMVYDYVFDNFTNIKWFYRGKLHLENAGFILHNYPVFILDKSMVVINSEKMHLTMNTLSRNQKVFNKFIEKYLEVYKNTIIFYENLEEFSKFELKFSIC